MPQSKRERGKRLAATRRNSQRKKPGLMLRGIPAILQNSVSQLADSHFTFINPLEENKICEEQIKNLSIKCYSKNTYVAKLSGGNKQKVSFAKWIANDSNVIIMDCPTRGVDVAVKQAMYRIIDDMKKQGKAILLISEELAELIGMCDRILIMKNFNVAKEFTRSADLKEVDIIDYML